MTQDELLALIDQAAEEGWTELDLSGKGLVMLPPEIGKLMQLETLILGKQDFEQKGPEGQAGWKRENDRWVAIVVGNAFTALPDELKALSKLKTLNLSGNLWGSLPSLVLELNGLENLKVIGCNLTEIPEAIAQLTNLTTLNLFSNQITEIPEVIAQLTNLTTLYLSSNQITEIPEAITQLTNLTDLRIDINRITEIPEVIAQLANLTTLLLHSNRITEIPEVIAQLTNLTELYLHSNQITEIPEVIAQLTNLTELYLFSNQITEIPEAIAQLTNLTRLDLSSNQITEIPEAIAQLTNLTRLDLSSNQITEIPEAIAQLTNLTTLYLSSNQITEIPEAIAQLTNLTRLDLSSNQITEIPEVIAQLANLTTLLLHSNQITEIPEVIAQLTNLTELYLSSNQITEIPEAIAQLTNLTTLYLSSNQITEIPEAITQLTNLTRLDLSSNQITEIPEAIAQLTNLTTLYLSSNQITEIPEAIAQLTNLTRLDLSSNQITEIPEAIAQLTNLTELYLSSNQITEIPEAIAQLTNLTELYLYNNQITAIPEAIAQLTKLKSLHLYNNQISEISDFLGELCSLTKLGLNDNQIIQIPETIGCLSNLKQLWLYNNQIIAIPEAIAQLTNLTELYLSSNQITEIPEVIAQLTNLAKLYLHGNQITEIPEVIAQLTNLTTLNLSSNQITEIPEVIAQLTNLTTLSLHSNQITEIPEVIAQLTNLTELYLSSNQITEIPEVIAQLSNLTTLNLHSNQITEITEAIETLPNLKSLTLRRNPLAIPTETLAYSEKEARRTIYPPIKLFKYLQELRSGEKRQLNEAKLLLIGQGSVGKTSLINRLINDTYNPNESQTDGLTVRIWPIEVNTKPVHLNVWDFGGQEIYHATHQFFLTKRSLYILTCNCRTSEDENRIEYWLKLINSFGGESPVIIVGNKSDEQPLDINRKALRDKYPNIKAIIETSCQSGQGIDELKANITYEVSQLSDVYNLLPLTWFQVKEQLEAMDEDFISYPQYTNLCYQQNVTDEQSQEQLIDLLHNLGLVLNFREHPILKDTNVLNPDWVTTGIYAILSDETLKTQNKGILTCDDLTRILNAQRYPAKRHPYLTELMREFQLGFPLNPALSNSQPQKFLIPGLLPKEEPENTNLQGDTLQFQYHYKVLPESIVSRFIVLTHEDIHAQTYWRSGVMLHYQDSGKTCNIARIKADPEDQKIFIAISGQANTRRTFLAMLRKTLDTIHKSFSSLEVTEWVPVPKHPDHPPLDYQEMLGLEKMGEQTYPIGKLGIRVNVRQLLDGYEPHEARQQRRREELGKDGLHEDEMMGKGYPDIHIDSRTFINQTQGESKPVSNTINQYGQGDNIGGDKVLGDKIGTQINNNANLAQSIRDLKAIFAELDQSYDKTTPVGQLTIATKAIEAIENKPTLKARVVNALKEGGAVAIEKAIDHPAIGTVVATAKGFIDA